MDLRFLLDRRHFLRHTVGGLSGVALTDLLLRDRLLSAKEQTPIRPQIDPQGAPPFAFSLAAFDRSKPGAKVSLGKDGSGENARRSQPNGY